MKNFIKGLLISLVVVIATTACTTGNSESSGKVLRLAQAESATSLNILFTSTSTNYNVISNLSEGLLQYDKEGNLIGAIAESFEKSEDGLTYTFKLRDAKWENGESITANDFVYSYQLRLKEEKSVYRHYLAYLKNGAKIISGEKQVTDLGVKAVSDKELVIELEEPKTFFQDMLVFPAFFPLNEQFVENIGVEAYGTSTETFLANGAYRLSSFTQDEGWLYQKNENYWDTQNVDIDEINVRVVPEAQTQKILWEQGEIDVLTLGVDDVTEFKDSKFLHQELTPRINYFYLSNSTAKPNEILGNKNFRAAVAHSIDKTVITESILNDGSVAADYFVPKNVLSNDGKDFRDITSLESPIYNQQKAQEYLQTAKQELGIEGNFTVDLAVSDVQITKKIYENIKAQVEATLPDVTINLVTTPISTYFPMLYEHATPAAVSQLEPAYKDVEGFLYIFRTGLSQNFADWSNSEYDALYQKAESIEYSNDTAKRFEIYAEMEQILLEDYTIIPVYQSGTSYLIKEHISDYKLSSTVPHVNYKYIKIS